MNDLTIITVGLDGAAAVLRDSGCFGDVISLGSSSALIECARGQLSTLDKDHTVFLVAASTPDDYPQMNLTGVFGRLGPAGYHVIVVDDNGLGDDMTAENPSVSLMGGPWTANLLLGAIAAQSSSISVDPVEWGDAELTAAALRSADAAHATPRPTAAPAPVPEPEPTPDWVKAATEKASSNPPAKPAAPLTPTWLSSADTETTPPPARPAPPKRPTPQSVTPAPQPVAPSPQPTPDVLAPPAPVPAPATPKFRPPAPPTIRKPGPATSSIRRPSAGVRAPSAPRVREGSPDRLGVVIVVTAPKGGVGKSTMAVSLATALGLRVKSSGRRVAVVDANYQQADVAKLLRCHDQAHSINDLARDPSLLAEEHIESVMQHLPPLNLSLLTGVTQRAEIHAELITPELYRRAVEVLRRRFDYVIVDTEVATRGLDMHTDFAYPVADFVIIPVTPDINVLQNVHDYLLGTVLPAAPAGYGFPADRIGWVLNRAEDDISMSEEQVTEILAGTGVSYLGPVVDSKAVRKATNLGQNPATLAMADYNTALAQVLYAAISKLVPPTEPSLHTLAPDVALAAPERTGVLTQLISVLRRGS